MWLKEYYEVLGAATKKAQAYTDQEVSKVRTKFAVVASYADLPNPGRTDTIYLVPKSGFVSVYDQYIYENDQYTDIGDTELDLDSYATDLELSQGLATKVDKIEGKGLSTNDYTNEDQAKVQQFEIDAELSTESTNAIQNKAVTEKFEEVEAEIFNEDKVAEGNPITIETGSIGTAKSTELTMSPIQDLHGYGKPWAAGQSEQLLDESTIEFGTIDQTTGQNAPSSGVKRSLYMPTKGATNLFLSSNGSMRFFWYDANKNYLSNDATNKNTSVAVPNNTAYFRIIGLAELFDRWTMINSGTTEKAYCPYSNVCPISGRTQAVIDGYGKNFVQFPTIDDTVNGVKYLSENNTLSIKRTASSSSNSSPINSAIMSTYSTLPWGPFPSGTYSVIIKDFVGQATTDRITFTARYDDDMAVVESQRISGESNQIPNGTGRKVTFTATKPFKCGIWMVVTSSTDIDCVAKIQMEVGTEITDIVPYVQGDSVTRNYGQTVYGGSDAIETGELKVTHAMVDLGSLNWTYNTGVNAYGKSSELADAMSGNPVDVICDSFVSDNTATTVALQENNSIRMATKYLFVKANYASQAAFESAINGMYACYPLATPQTITLTPAQINLIKGLNNISTDADSIKMIYTINNFVTETEMNTALESKANVIDLNGKADLTSFGPYEAGPIASTNYAEGDYMIFEGKFCKASSAITAGDTLEIGTNLTETTIAAELLAIISQLPTT